MLQCYGLAWPSQHCCIVPWAWSAAASRQQAVGTSWELHGSPESNCPWPCGGDRAQQAGHKDVLPSAQPWHLPLPPSHPLEPQEMCSSNPIIALPCSSPMCFAFEIAGSLCNYTTSSNHIPFVRKSPALLAILSLAVRQERAAQCTNSSLPPTPYLSPPVKSGTQRL